MFFTSVGGSAKRDSKFIEGRCAAERPEAGVDMGNIFISYRREDSQHITDRIFDHLVRHFDRKTLFKDVDNIPIGVDFRAHIDAAVANSDVVLAIIGPAWVSVRGADGKRRLDQPNDAVAIEIGSALKRGRKVVPVLVGNATMPDANELPDALKPLATINAVSIRPDPDFSGDFGRLARALKDLTGEPPHRSWAKPVAAVAAAAALGAIVYFVMSSPPNPSQGVRPTASGAPPKNQKDCREYTFTDVTKVPPVTEKRWDCN